jgi:hypothetical protein
MGTIHAANVTAAGRSAPALGAMYELAYAFLGRPGAVAFLVRWMSFRTNRATAHTLGHYASRECPKRLHGRLDVLGSESRWQATRTVKIAGITPHQHERWMMRMARNLTDVEEPFLRHSRFLIMDRDTKYSVTFRAALTRERVEAIRLPPRSPNLNAYVS